MNQSSVLFVVCVNDEALYSQCIRHILHLAVPPSYSYDILPVRGSTSMASSYNLALDHPSKYKVYLHQDTFIIHRNFLNDVLQLFQQNKELGLLGVAGCETMPSNGIWWESERKAGKVIEYRAGCFSTLQFESSGSENHSFTPAEAVDGLLIATQYDLKWRDDLFEGFHFYDSSQSIEFQKHGYQIGIARQEEPWCLHYCGDSFDAEAYEKDRKIFVRHYITNSPR